MDLRSRTVVIPLASPLCRRRGASVPDSERTGSVTCGFKARQFSRLGPSRAKRRGGAAVARTAVVCHIARAGLLRRRAKLAYNRVLRRIEGS